MRLRVEGGGELKVGETIYVRFELPELDGPVEVSGKVRWVDRIDPQMGGMQFADGLRAKQVWAINRLGG
jgi:Tfp pilus assembly protein PilZ